MKNLVSVCSLLVFRLLAADVPAEIGTFRLLASRRYILDNELPLAELKPAAVSVASLQHPLVWREGEPSASFTGAQLVFSAPEDAASCAALVGGWLPGAHYAADYASLSEGAGADLVWRDEPSGVFLRVHAVPGHPVEFAETVDGSPVPAKLEKPEVVPAPPFRLSAVVAGPTMLIAARKDGVVRYLGSVTFADEPDLRARKFLGALKFAAGASLPAKGRAVLSGASMALTAGVGQADFRIVTDGPGCRPYFENDRMFCTFSARAGFKYVKSVASFNPTLFDFRMEGVLFTNYGAGDDLLRNDAVNHLFFDRTYFYGVN